MRLVILLTTALLLGGCTVYNTGTHGGYYPQHGYYPGYYPEDPWPVRVPVYQPRVYYPHY